MKKTLLYAAMLVAFASCNDKTKSTSEKTNSADSSTKEAVASSASTEAPVDSATMMKNWETYMTPSDIHKMMASWDGKWKGDITMWQTADSEPMKTTGITTNKMVLEGRYQQSTHSGDMMGMPMEGMSTLGYDNAKKTFTNTWIDNMGTGIMVMEGPWDEATKTITFKGKMVDPTSTKVSELDVKETFKVVDDNNVLMEMFCKGKDGREYKTMQIKYVRM